MEDKINYTPITSQEATFKSGARKKIHNWFRLTPSFGPDLVDIMLKKLHHREGELVLDPFCGASTTLIQSRLNQVDSIGFEINPLLYFVGKTSLNWGLDPAALEASLLRLEQRFNGLSKKLEGIGVEECGLPIPKIHNVYRWWRKDILKELLILKEVIRSPELDRERKDFLSLGLAGVLVPDLTNVTLGRLQLHFINRDNDDIRVFDTFREHIGMMIDDMRIIRAEYAGQEAAAILYHTDATDIRHLNLDRKVNMVITSPPYPNRYSYVWNTRPHLYFLDIFENPAQASGLDSKTIGGTWGVATSHLMKGEIEPLYPILAKVVSPIVARIRQKDNLMANYVIKYFNLLARQIVEMERIAAEDIRIAYVVGNSEIKGVYIETDVLLARIVEGLGLGYGVSEITRFRKRNSGVDLYESIVYAAKNPRQ
jgi:hypothetical protein